MKIVYVSGIMLLCSLFSCQTETVQCNKAAVDICFVGFTNSEVNNVVVYAYKKDNLFDTLVDSMIVAGQQQGTIYSDTMLSEHPLDDGEDYRVKLQGSNTVYSITGLTPGNHYSERIQTGIGDMVKYGCINNTVSYTLNGQLTGQPNVMSGIYNTVYIVK